MGVAPAGHARGSQGSRFEVTGEGGAMADAVGEVVDGVDDEEPPDPPGAEVPGVEEALDGLEVLTANWVPVTTVTWAPSVTWLGL